MSDALTLGAAPWLAAYPESFPHSFTPSHADMLRLFHDTVSKARDCEAIRYFGGTLTYGELDALSDAFAVWLAEQ